MSDWAFPNIKLGASKGRLWVVHCLLTSRGARWQEVLVVDPDGSGPDRAFDSELWLAPDGRLWFFWAQTVGLEGTVAVWAMVNENPENPQAGWSEPRRGGCAAKVAGIRRGDDSRADGTIYITYDYDRYGAQEVIAAVFREEDIDAGQARFVQAYRNPGAPRPGVEKRY